jgi:hypothetical protein
MLRSRKAKKEQDPKEGSTWRNLFEEVEKDDTLPDPKEYENLTKSTGSK